VISTISGHGLDTQVPLAVAAKAAGVKLFVPSEFGNNTDDVKDGMLAAKTAVVSKLKEIGLPYTSYYTGPFSDFLWNG
jgi:hypothetical protein